MKSEIKDFLKDFSYNRKNKEDLEKFLYYLVDKTQKIMINRYKIYTPKETDKVLNQLCKQIK